MGTTPRTAVLVVDSPYHAGGKTHTPICPHVRTQVNLSTRPEKSVGDDEIWSTAEAALVEALGAKGWSYQVGSQIDRPRPRCGAIACCL